MDAPFDEHVSCVICTNDYSASLNKPKFLRCHHILCVLCAQVGKLKTIMCDIFKELKLNEDLKLLFLGQIYNMWLIFYSRLT